MKNGVVADGGDQAADEQREDQQPALPNVPAMPATVCDFTALETGRTTS